MSANGRQGALLREQVGSAWRPSRRDGSLEAHPAWHDLTDADRVVAFEQTVALRRIEAAIDPDGLSTTGGAVLARIVGARQT